MEPGFLEQVAEALHDTRGELWYAALRAGRFLGTLELHELKDALGERLTKCQGCDETWVGVEWRFEFCSECEQRMMDEIEQEIEELGWRRDKLECSLIDRRAAKASA